VNLSGIDKYELLSDLAKRRGFFWPSFEIYGGVSGYMDLGPLGTRMKRRIEDRWLQLFVYQHGFAAISSPVITPERVFMASGHIENFKDLMVTCDECHRHFKADHVITEAMPGRTDLAIEAMAEQEIDKFIEENQIRCPECGGLLSRSEYFSTMFKTNIGPYGDVVGYARPEAAQGMFVDFKRVYDTSRGKLPLGIAQIGTVMRNEISPRQGPLRLREFTIMELEFFFDTKQQDCEYMERVRDVNLPILLAKDREQNHIQLTNIHAAEASSRGFVKYDWLAYFMALSVKFANSLGIPVDKQRFEEKLPTERSHYSAQTFDHQIWLDRWGWVEIAGHACRTDFDLSAHAKGSGVDLSVFEPFSTPIERRETAVVPIGSLLGPVLREKTTSVIQQLVSTNPEKLQKAFNDVGYFEIQGFKILPSQVRLEDRVIRETGRRFMPHVVEPSFGAERIVYSTLEYAYTRAEDRVVLKIPRQLAPLQMTVFPLMAKDGLPRVAREIADSLAAENFDVEYDEAGTIGKRYARADEIGVPISITVDYQTLRDQTVTLRDRDTWLQVRTDRKALPELASRFLKGNVAFSTLGSPVKAVYE
jgi:glycyl-tRNA synthetase